MKNEIPMSSRAVIAIDSDIDSFLIKWDEDAKAHCKKIHNLQNDLSEHCFNMPPGLYSATMTILEESETDIEVNWEIDNVICVLDSTPRILGKG